MSLRKSVMNAWCCCEYRSYFENTVMSAVSLPFTVRVEVPTDETRPRCHILDAGRLGVELWKPAVVIPFVEWTRRHDDACLGDRGRLGGELLARAVQATIALAVAVLIAEVPTEPSRALLSGRGRLREQGEHGVGLIERPQVSGLPESKRDLLACRQRRREPLDERGHVVEVEVRTAGVVRVPGSDHLLESLNSHDATPSPSIVSTSADCPPQRACTSARTVACCSSLIGAIG